MRALVSVAVAATGLLKVGEFEDRLATVEAAMARRDRSGGDDPDGLP